MHHVTLVPSVEVPWCPPDNTIRSSKWSHLALTQGARPSNPRTDLTEGAQRLSSVSCFPDHDVSVIKCTYYQEPSITIPTCVSTLVRTGNIISINLATFGSTWFILHSCFHCCSCCCFHCLLVAHARTHTHNFFSATKLHMSYGF